MGKVREVLACSECGQPQSRWVGRCPGCGAWGSVTQVVPTARAGPASSVAPLGHSSESPPRVSTGFEGLDRVLGGGVVPGSVVLLAGEPGIGKSTLLLQVLSRMSEEGQRCMVASGEESRAQVAARAGRLGLATEALAFTSGRELTPLIEAARAEQPFLLAVDSIQTLRDPDAGGTAGGPSQVRACTDALVGLAKSEGIAILLAGHVTKDGDLAGPRTLEHAVDAVLSFEGDPRSGQRVVSGGKNRFGAEGEMAWFEMGPQGLSEVDPGALLGSGEAEPGSATALPMAGRRALAVEVQALVVPSGGSARRQTTGLDAKRFSLVAAVVDRILRIPLSGSDLYGASSGGMRLDDPGCDLAVAAALVSAATGSAPPPSSAFIGEIGLTGAIRPVPGLAQRIAVASARGVETVYAPLAEPAPGAVAVGRLADAFPWAS